MNWDALGRWFRGHGHDPAAHRRLRARVAAAAQASGAGLTCDLCNNAAWWPANGFSEGERQQMCGPRDLNCPGFGGDESQ